MSSTYMTKTLSSRSKTSVDYDRESFEKSQKESLNKAIIQAECAMKEKHARIIVIGTHKERGSMTYWTLVLKMQLQDHPVIAWKFCHLTHKILRDGHPNVLIESQKYQGFLTDLGKLWGHLRDGYGRIISAYCQLLDRKLIFHRKNPIPGNLHMEDEQLNKICNNDINTYFELSVDMLDYMDDILQLQTFVFNSLDMTRANSMTASGQCRLAPLILCIQDSCHLYDYIVKILFRLHSNLPPDTLSGHRERFNKQFRILKKFYSAAQTLQYFRTLIRVPVLPDCAPNFLRASELQSHVKPMFVIPEPEPEQENESETNIVDFLVDTTPVPQEKEEVRMTNTNFAPPDENLEREIMMKQIKSENDTIKRDMARIKIEDKAVMESLHIHIQDLEREISELKQIAEHTSHDNAMLKAILKDSEKNEEASMKLNAMENIAKSNEEKFNKMKDIYSKLREEHVQLLKTHGEVNKQLNNEKRLKEEHKNKLKEVEEVQLLRSSIPDETITLRNELDASKEEIASLRRILENEKLEKDAIKNELVLVGSSRSEVENLQKKTDALLLEKSNQISKLNEELRELKNKQSGLEDKLSSCGKSLEIFETRSKQLEEDRFNESNEINKLKLELNAVTAALSQEKLSKLEVINKMEVEKKNCLDAVISKCKDEIMYAMVQVGDPNFSSIRSTAEYLLIRIKESLDSTSKFKCIDSNDKQNGNPVTIKYLIDFCSKISSTIVFGLATANSASIEAGHDLSNLSKELGDESIKMLESFNYSSTDASMVNDILTKLQNLSTELVPKFEDVQVEKMGDLIDEELLLTTKAIESAANKLNEMLATSRQNQSGVQLEVNEKILDSCNSLMNRIKILIEKSKILQKEIVAQGRGTSTIKDFYKKHHRWTEGLISAAKAVGFGAHVLVEAADKMVVGSCKYEELVVCAQEIAASTAQLVVASKVKASKDSQNLTKLSDASKSVSEATGLVVAEAKAAAERIEDSELLDFSKITLHQAKKKKVPTATLR